VKVIILINLSEIIGSLQQALKDGQIICKAVNKLIPRSMAQVNFSVSQLPFKQMDNISLFLKKAIELGVPVENTFQTNDLFDAKNMKQVCLCIVLLSSYAEKHGYRQVKRLGAAVLEKEPAKDFSHKKGEYVVPLLTAFKVTIY
jgi:hypothetical protein